MAEEEATNKNATIIDVARKCGVSVATVSRVVNKSYPVSEKTRERVQAAIDELHYVPNVQARELNLRQSTTIGVVVPGLYNMFFAKIIDGIEQRQVFPASFLRAQGSRPGAGRSEGIDSAQRGRHHNHQL